MLEVEMKFPISDFTAVESRLAAADARPFAARHDIETLVGLDEFYAIEEETVEERKWGER